jgi:hypothetical protein
MPGKPATHNRTGDSQHRAIACDRDTCHTLVPGPAFGRGKAKG